MAFESSINEYLSHYESMNEELYHKEFIVSMPSISTRHAMGSHTWGFSVALASYERSGDV